MTTGELTAAASHPHSRGRLLQVLGMWFGIAAGIGNSIAAGIVRTPGDIAKGLPNGWLFMGLWMIGGLYALSGAPSIAELGAAIPRSGGQYNFSRRALGEYAGFVVGWSDWLSTCGTAAAVGIVIAEYTGALVPILAGTIAIDGHVFTIQKITAVSVILGFFVLQWRGISWGKGTQFATAAIKTGAFLILVIACLVLGGPAHHAAVAANSSQAAPSGSAGGLVIPSGWAFLVAVFLGLQAVVYTVDGWTGIIYFGEEVCKPGRDIPRAIFGSVFSIMGVYLLLNAVALYILPMKEIAGNTFVLGTVANRVFGSFGDPAIRSIMLISLLSCLNANQLFCTRTLYAMSCDGLFFRTASRVNAGGTPTIALFLSTVASVLFVLGSFERVIAMLSFFFVANYALTYVSLLALRKREPQMDRPYRAWGYPWTTIIALAGSLLFLVGSIATDRDNAPLALMILVLSYPVFRVLKLVSRRESAAPSKDFAS